MKVGNHPADDIPAEAWGYHNRCGGLYAVASFLDCCLRERAEEIRSLIGRDAVFIGLPLTEMKIIERPCFLGLASEIGETFEGADGSRSDSRNQVCGISS